MLKVISASTLALLGMALSSATAAGQGFMIATVAGNDTVGYSGDDGPAIAAQLDNPQSVALDATGNLYIADWFNNVVREVTVNGNITTVAGNGTRGYSGDGGPAISAQLSFPYALAFDRAGDLFIADSSNDVIREVTPDGNITTVAGTNVPGYSGDGGPATNAQLYDPSGVAVDSTGNLYIADSNNHVIREVLAGGEILTLGGNRYPGYSGDGGPVGSAQFNYPKGLAIDAAGNLYVADFGNSVIRMITPNGAVTTVAGTGTPGYLGDGGPAIHAELAYPESVALDSAGNLYIADSANQVIREVSNGSIATIAGNATAGYSGDGGPATSATMFFPKGVVVGSSGSIYIADWDNDVIRMLTPDTTASDGRQRTTIR